MAHKTLYIRPNDESLWAAAQRVANRTDVSVSRIVTEALKLQLPRIVELIEQQKREQPVDEWASFAADVV
ncbi:MAG TPA: hypothetical protein VI172_14440 [Candidatus Dormibacteraeota bacterium]|jgi:hypothetical protein